MAVEENRIHFRKLVQTLQWTFLMLLSVQHNLSKTQTVLFTLVSGVTCLYVGLLGLRLRAGVVWRGRGRGSSCPALTLLATVCTAHVRHAGTRETRGDTCLLTWCRGSGAPLRCRRCHVPSHIPAPAACHDVTCHVLRVGTCTAAPQLGHLSLSPALAATIYIAAAAPIWRM